MKNMRRTLSIPALLAVILSFFAGFAALHAPAATPQQSTAATPRPQASPEDLLARIRRRFRAHRPPPPFETYTLVRNQQTSYGYPDYADSYTYHIWYRSNDHAALERKVTKLGSVGQLEFKRPMFNVADDPGPPTADVFEPAPLHTLAPDFIPTPEASLPPTLVTIKVRGEFDYRVSSVQHEGSQLHLTIVPRRDPDRNRLRELWVDDKTLDVQKIVATDKLFVSGPGVPMKVYPVLFTIDFEMYEGIPVITHLHGVVGGDYDGDGQTVDYEFKDLVFPLNLPDWYFNSRQYASHQEDAPE